MSFRLNDCEQLTLFTQLGFMSQKKLDALQKTWAQVFSDRIFKKIDEEMFAPLYSQNANSRPNAPINVIVGALILKEYTGLTDDELIESCMYDFRFQYALHITSYDHVPLSDRTFSRFRERVAAYELTSGVDLIHDCVVKLADELKKEMKISGRTVRVDSMMVESNIRKMGRLELLYTCVADLVKLLQKNGRTDLIGRLHLEHYVQPDDRNRVIYHDTETPKEKQLQRILRDAEALLPECEEDFGETTDYQLLERAVREQTKKDDNGHLIPKTKDDAMGSDILQNPSDPDATYRKKAGKEHRGYAANLTEEVDESGSIVVDYQYDTNNTSDGKFITEELNGMEAKPEPTTMVADGGYAGKKISDLAGSKNIDLVTTGLKGHNPDPILNEFQYNGNGSVAACPMGNNPQKSSVDRKSGIVRSSFLRSQCESCPYKDRCRAKLHKRTAVVIINPAARKRLELIEKRKNDKQLKFLGRVRNGVETIPSVLRRKYHVDRMPVRGKLRTKQFFGFKIAALNFSKVVRSERGLEKCRSFQTE